MKRIIKLTESDLTRIVKRVISEGSYIDTKKNKIIYVNNNSVNYIKNRYLSDNKINGTVKDIIISAAGKFLKEVNSNANKTVNEMINSGGTESATFYLDAVKKSVYETVNEIAGVKKVLLRNLMSKEEFKKLIDLNSNTIYSLLTTLTINSFMEMHDTNKVNEVEWYDQAYDTASKRIDQIEKHLIDWITKQFYG